MSKVTFQAVDSSGQVVFRAEVFSEKYQDRAEFTRAVSLVREVLQKRFPDLNEVNE